MSIIHSFDPVSPEIIAPAQVIAPVKDFPEVFLSAFSHRFYDAMMQMPGIENIGHMGAGRDIGIYRFLYGGKAMGFYHTLLGGAGSAALLEEVIAKGCKKILFFGAAGSLDKNLTAGHLVVPTAAWRDEGTSYHYAPADDWLRIGTADELAGVLDQLEVPYVKAKTWTTDAFYRETQNNMAARKAAGCAVVEMECASVMAVGQFRGIKVYQFLYAADCLDENTWNKRILGGMPADMNAKLLKIALEAVARL